MAFVARHCRHASHHAGNAAPEYLALGSGDDERYTRYRALVLQHETEAMTAQLRDATQQNAAFGSPRFAREIEQMLGRDASIKPRGRPRKDAT